MRFNHVIMVSEFGDATNTHDRQAAIFVASLQSHTELCSESRSNIALLSRGDWRLLTGNKVATGFCAFTHLKGDAKMLLVSIHRGLATVTLTPEDCQTLARMCQVASNHLLSLEETPIHDKANDLNAAFSAMAIASAGQAEMSLADQETVDARLSSVH